MRHDSPPEIISGQDYAVLRQIGSQPARVQAELRLTPGQTRRLERLFRRQQAKGGKDRQDPRCARHEAHVAAVMAQGGFWALSERRVGRGMALLGLPLIPPEGRP